MGAETERVGEFFLLYLFSLHIRKLRKFLNLCNRHSVYKPSLGLTVASHATAHKHKRCATFRRLMRKNGIFISYSHKDKTWLDKIMVHLKPLIRKEKIRVWDDSQIKPGTSWNEEIKKAINESRIALLLVSANFLNSDFIMENEFPQILGNAEKGNTLIYWVAIGHSLYDETALKDIQAVNDPNLPLQQFNEADLDKELVSISRKVSNAIEVNMISNFTKVVDEFVPQQKAFLDKKPLDVKDRDFSLQANQINDEIHFTSGDYLFEKITVDDFDKLDKGSKQLLRSFERTMNDLFDRWTELRPKSEDRDEFVKEDARKEMSEIRKSLCVELNSILDFLGSMGKHLDDHYHHVRYICSQAEN